jgi:RNA polymerase sigma-70 factor (ECF subfamily)
VTAIGDTSAQLALRDPDVRLMLAVRDDQNGAFAELVEQYQHRLITVMQHLIGNAAEAEDLAQEVFLRLYRRPLEPGREHNLGAWLYRVATHLGYNALRSRSRRKRHQAAAALEAPPGPTDVVDETLRRAEQDVVHAALAALKPQQAQLLVLRHAGLSYAELAEVLEVAPGSIGTLLARAERAFRDAYLALE